MAKHNKGKNHQENATIDLLNNEMKTKDDQTNEKQATIDAYRLEIKNLKKKVADQEETIDELVQERDDVYNDLYNVRLILADAWNISRATNAEKIWEVLRRTRGMNEKQAEKKSYSAAAQLSENGSDKEKKNM